MESMIAENNYQDLFMIPQFIKQIVISFIKVVALLSIVGYTAMIAYNHFGRKENE
jgi:hypothetical protein